MIIPVYILKTKLFFDDLKEDFKKSKKNNKLLSKL